LSGDALGIPDDAKRLADAVNLHIHAQGNEAAYKAMAFRLEDGSSDGTLYDTRDDALRAVDNKPGVWGVLQIPPTGTTAIEMVSALKWARFTFYKLGRQASAPGPMPIMPNSRQDLAALIAGR
jgi:hypothetical protein